MNHTPSEDPRGHPSGPDLRSVLDDAVSDVHPAYRLDTIRARTRRTSWSRRSYAVGGAVVAAAAAVALVAVVTGRPPEPTRPDVATAPPSHAAAVYFVGDTPLGPRLYREFQRVPDQPGLGGELAALSAPDDPDYTTSWPAGWLRSAQVLDGVIEVEIDPDAPVDTILADCDPTQPVLQQVVYTLQAAVGARLPVRLPSCDTSIAAVPELDILSLVNVSDPAEGEEVGSTLAARGIASSFEATVPWQIRDADDQLVLDGFTTAEGWMDALYPWEAEIDVSGLEPGSYTFVALTDDPSDGEGVGPFSDTRTIVVR